MTLNVLFSPTSAMPGFELIQTMLSSDIEVAFSEEIPKKADYHVLVSATPTRNHLTASANLHTLIAPFSGPSPNIVRLVSNFPHVALHQLPYNSAAVAETALALLLACAKSIVPTDAAMRRNDWSPRYAMQPQTLLRGQKVLLLGYGRVGSYLASILSALKMEVMAIRRHLHKQNELDAHVKQYGFDALSTLLPKADVLICTLPNTPETEGWIGSRELGMMKKSAIIVNVGQGKVFDEAALFAALKGKHIAGAGLDVWYDYPVSASERTNKRPSRFPFANLSNVVMSPHRAGQLGQEDGGRVKMLADMLHTAKQGESLPYQVDLDLGY